MSKEAEKQDHSELLVVAMTRPAMIKGMTITSIVFSILIPAAIAFVFRNAWLFFLTGPAFLASYLICLKDIYLFEIILAWSHTKECKNKKHWGYKSYAPR